MRDDSTLEEGEISSSETAAVVGTLLEMNANEDGNGEIGNRNHEPVTDGADGAGQGVAGQVPASTALARGAGRAVGMQGERGHVARKHERVIHDQHALDGPS